MGGVIVKARIIDTYRQIQFIQVRFQLEHTIHEAKIEVLVNFWNKIIWELKTKAIILRDKTTSALVTRFLAVPEKVRRDCLSKYLKSCRLLHAIAFFQWRNKFPNKIKHNKNQLDELISEKTSFLYSKIAKTKPTDETLKSSKLRPDFFKHYVYFNQKEEAWAIQSFHQIGMCDPFNISEEVDLKMQRQKEKATNRNFKNKLGSMILHKVFDLKVESELLYAESRYVVGESPKPVYLPSRKMMFKLMRACLEVKEVSSLWFRRESIED